MAVNTTGAAIVLGTGVPDPAGGAARRVASSSTDNTLSAARFHDAAGLRSEARSLQPPDCRFGALPNVVATWAAHRHFNAGPNYT